jgi:hypothetical protein
MRQHQTLITTILSGLAFVTLCAAIAVGEDSKTPHNCDAKDGVVAKFYCPLAVVVEGAPVSEVQCFTLEPDKCKGHRVIVVDNAVIVEKAPLCLNEGCKQIRVHSREAWTKTMTEEESYLNVRGLCLTCANKVRAGEGRYAKE